MNEQIKRSYPYSNNSLPLPPSPEEVGAAELIEAFFREPAVSLPTAEPNNIWYFQTPGQI